MRTTQILINQEVHSSTTYERMFSVLMIFQWLLAIGLALSHSPLTWAGSESTVSIQVYMAVVLGGALSGLPLFLMWKRPGDSMNRYVVTVCQMLYSTLLVHLSGGRVETHFHIFGSLALLAVYRDWRVLIIASVISGIDHLLGGYYWPQSTYGVLVATPWRAFEHVGWLIFEDIFLLFSVKVAADEAMLIAKVQAHLEATLSTVEEKVELRTTQLALRTKELEESNAVIRDQQNSLLASTKTSALGEMAGQIAHEINTPLGAIVLTTEGLIKRVEREVVPGSEVAAKLQFILKVTNKMSRIIGSMRKLAGHGASENVTEVLVSELVADLLLLSEGRFKKNGIQFEFRDDLAPGSIIQCRPNEISQILLILLNNASDAIGSLPQPSIQLHLFAKADQFIFEVIDSGPGISAQNLEKLFTPNFSTKSLDQGTGFGLSIAKKLVERHRGRIFVDGARATTTFVVELPIQQTEALARVSGI